MQKARFTDVSPAHRAGTGPTQRFCEGFLAWAICSHPAPSSSGGVVIRPHKIATIAHSSHQNAAVARRILRTTTDAKPCKIMLIFEHVPLRGAKIKQYIA
jgi:hypothetical protein